MKGTTDELKEDMETLLSMTIEVKKNNTDEFMIYFKERVNGLVSKYFGDVDDQSTSGKEGSKNDLQVA